MKRRLKSEVAKPKHGKEEKTKQNLGIDSPVYISYGYPFS